MQRLIIRKRHVSNTNAPNFCAGGAAAKGKRQFWQCKCPVYWQIAGRDQQRHIISGVTTYKEAAAYKAEKEAELREKTSLNPTIQFAIVDFTRWMKNAEGRQKETMRKYGLIFRDLMAFCTDRGLQLVKDLDKPTTKDFYSAWVMRDRNGNVLRDKETEDTVSINPNTRRVRLGCVRRFGQYLVEMGWLAENPASKKNIPDPQTGEPSGRPFEPDEIETIWKVIQKRIAKHRDAPIYRDAWNRYFSFCLLMRYAGLAQTDALHAGPSNLSGGMFCYRRRKTLRKRSSKLIQIPLPPFLVARLKDPMLTPPKSEQYWFWSGNGEATTWAKDYHKALARIFKLAGLVVTVDGKEKVWAHSHMFRHTFAVELLKSGVHPKQVARMMGHASVVTTEMYYAKYTQSWQAETEQAIRLSWPRDTFLNQRTGIVVAPPVKSGHGEQGVA